MIRTFISVLLLFGLFFWLTQPVLAYVPNTSEINIPIISSFLNFKFDIVQTTEVGMQRWEALLNGYKIERPL